jgi:hypothetical protein
VRREIDAEGKTGADVRKPRAHEVGRQVMSRRTRTEPERFISKSMARDDVARGEIAERQDAP